MSTSTANASGWALRLPAREASAALALRLLAGVEIGEAPGEVWLRGRQADEVLTGALNALPAMERFAWSPADGRLRPPGARLATAELPALAWRPLAEWGHLALPIARLAADLPPPLQLQLERSHDTRAVNAAVLPAAVFLDWMQSAPELRLRRLRFAVSERGEALVLGTPLPPVPLRAAVETAGVVVPAGFAWQPAVSADTVRRVLGATERDVIWWDEAGARLLPAEVFVAASRGAARATRTAGRGESGGEGV